MESRDREERINEKTVVGGSHLGEEQEEEKEKIDPFLKGGKQRRLRKQNEIQEKNSWRSLGLLRLVSS